MKLKNIKLGLFMKMVIFYISIMGLYHITDKLYGAAYMIRLNELGISITLIGLLMSIEEIVTLLAEYPSGIISDMIGRKKTTGIALILFGISIFIFSISKSIIFILLSFILMPFSLALFSGSPQSWFYDKMASLKMLEKRKEIIPKMNSTIMIISMLGSVLAVILIKFGSHWPLYIAAIVSIFGGIITLIMFDDNKGDINKSFAFNILNLTKKFFKDKRMVNLAIQQITGYVGFVVFILTWQLCLLNKFNFKKESISILMIILMGLLALGNYLSGILAKRLSMLNVTIISRIILTLSFLCFCVSNKLIIFMFSLILYEIGSGMESSSTSTWVNDYISSDNRASFYSALSSLQSLAGIALFTFIGILIDNFSYFIGWLIALLFEIISIFVLILFIRKYKNKYEIKE